MNIKMKIFDVNNIMDAITHDEQMTQSEKEWVLNLISEKHPDVTSLTVTIEGESKKDLTIDDVTLPDYLDKIPTGLVKLNFTDLRTRSRHFMSKHGGIITIEGVIDSLLQCTMPFTEKTKTRRCRECKGSIFEKISDTEVAGIRYTTWKCMNCGKIMPMEQLAKSMTEQAKNKEVSG